MPADILYLDCHRRTPTFSTLIVLLRNDSGGDPSYWLLVTRTPTPRRAGRDTPRPGSTHANRVCAGPGIHPRKLCLRGARGRWAFIRPTRRITVILSILWRWALVTSYSQLVTRDRSPFAEATGDKSSFAKASGDKPPRRQAATPPQRGTLFRDGNVPSSPPLGEELYSAGAFYFWVKKSPVWGDYFFDDQNNDQSHPMPVQPNIQLARRTRIISCLFLPV